jgi:hypothetical protein
VIACGKRDPDGIHQATDGLVRDEIVEPSTAELGGIGAEAFGHRPVIKTYLGAGCHLEISWSRDRVTSAAREARTSRPRR